MVPTLHVGIVGSGFIAGFHVRAFERIRGVEVVAIASLDPASASALAEYIQEREMGDEVTCYGDVAELARDKRVEAIWILTPNNTRVELIDTICQEVVAGNAELVGLAIEKPIARTLGEALQVRDAIQRAGVLVGYLENQVYSPRLTRLRDVVWARGAAVSGSPYLARCTEEHAGPHSAWFWDTQAQGGGAMNDLMCHSIEAGRFLLTPPGADQNEWLTPVSVTATIASLRWGRDYYADLLRERYPGVQDYRVSPAEDYASATFRFINGDHEPVIVEATCSWGYVGAGMRLSFDLLGPEYSMSTNSLTGDGSVFFSRELSQAAGEDLVEKQNAEQGLMPVVADEPATYGYLAEDSHVVSQFAHRLPPREGVDHAVAVTELLMAAYLAAETETVVHFPVDLADFIPAVAERRWHPRTGSGTTIEGGARR